VPVTLVVRGPAVVRLTAAELELADWAIDPMGDYWVEQVEEGVVEREPELLPSVEGSDLLLPMDLDVIEDFLYRLEEQAIDMANDEARGRPGDMYKNAVPLRRPVLSLARKIRQVAAEAGFANVGVRL